MKKFDKVTVVGSGSAGCMAANYFAQNMGCHVTQIVSGNPIGVGEATIIGFDDFLHEAGLTNPVEWMYKTDATIKNGILFDGWREDGENAWHPFRDEANYQVADQKTYDNYKDYLEESFNYKACYHDNENPHNCKLAFHIDALKLVSHLLEKFEARDNTTIIRGKVNAVEFSKDDDMEIIKLVGTDEKDSSKIWSIDNPGLIIDATGFNGLQSILPDRWKGDYEDVSDMLCHNAAIAAPIKYSTGYYFPYTKCSFVGNGWIWNIPLKTRIGSGIVYNTNDTTDEEALETFNKYHTNEVHTVDLSMDEVNTIKYNPTLLRNPFRGNLCNIGLASGFIEPLESTGLGLFIEAITVLYQETRRGYYGEVEQDLVNKIIYLKYREAAEFVSAHYELTHKKSKRKLEYVDNNYEIYKRMRHEDDKTSRLEVWHSLFSHYSWEFLYEGMMNKGDFKEKKDNVAA